jgi:hypothetical protein
LSLYSGSFFVFLPVYEMHHGKVWVVEQHTRAGVAHHLTYLLAHGGFVTMDSAIGAGGFVFLEWAMVDALHGVICQDLAFRAQGFCWMVVSLAIQPDHGLDRFSLA